MEPLSNCPGAVLASVRAVLLDIDDTLTTQGRLTASAYGALERLAEAGLWVVPITGRPAGWCDHIARMWPVRAVVGENGAFYFHYDSGAGKLRQRFLVPDAERAANRRRLEDVRERILREIPGTAVASDQHYRESDLAIDFCEDVVPLDDRSVERIVDLFAAVGASAKVSSIHVNGWYGDYDKLSMTRIAFRELFDVNLDDQREELLFVGDSPNDAPMFSHFPVSVGVANVRDFAGRLDAKPTYVTTARCGAGFVELAEALLASR